MKKKDIEFKVVISILMTKAGKCGFVSIIG